MAAAYTEAEQEIILQAKKKALKLLEYQDRTEKQLCDKLKEGGFPPFAVSEAVTYVRSFHYIDDERYAAAFVANRKASRSRFELYHMLKERGVSEELIERVLEDAELDETVTLETLFRKKFGTKDLTDPKTYEKAFRYFSTKGYRYQDIKKALENVIGESDAQA